MKEWPFSTCKTIAKVAINSPQVSFAVVWCDKNALACAFPQTSISAQEVKKPWIGNRRYSDQRSLNCACAEWSCDLRWCLRASATESRDRFGGIQTTATGILAPFFNQTTRVLTKRIAKKHLTYRNVLFSLRWTWKMRWIVLLSLPLIQILVLWYFCRWRSNLSVHIPTNFSCLID